MHIKQIIFNTKAIQPHRHLYIEETTEGIWIEVFDPSYQKKVLNPILVKLTGLNPFHFVKDNSDSYINEQLFWCAFQSDWFKNEEYLELRNGHLCVFIEDMTLDGLLALTNFKLVTH